MHQIEAMFWEIIIKFESNLSPWEFTGLYNVKEIDQLLRIKKSLTLDLKSFQYTFVKPRQSKLFLKVFQHSQVKNFTEWYSSSNLCRVFYFIRFLLNNFTISWPLQITFCSQWGRLSSWQQKSSWIGGRMVDQSCLFVKHAVSLSSFVCKPSIEQMLIVSTSRHRSAVSHSLVNDHVTFLKSSLTNTSACELSHLLPCRTEFKSALWTVAQK